MTELLSILMALGILGGWTPPEGLVNGLEGSEQTEVGGTATPPPPGATPGEGEGEGEGEDEGEADDDEDDPSNPVFSILDVLLPAINNGL